jgi:hypothetical protein
MVFKVGCATANWRASIMEFDFDLTVEMPELELVQLSTGEVVQYEVINNQIMEEVDNGNN